MRVCAGLWSLITPRWILISVWWDTKHQSQSTNALATNHFNEYILFWPLSELFFVFHITFPLPHYSLSVLALFCIHTLPFNSLSHPVMLLFFPSTCLSFSLTHLSFGFFPFVSSLFNIFPPLSSHAPFPSPQLLSASHPQLKPPNMPQRWSWCAFTQSGLRSKVSIGNTRIRAASWKCPATVLAASPPLCLCLSPLRQPGTTPAPYSWKMVR